MSDRDEWRSEVSRLNESQRYINTNEPRWAIGLVGDKEDAND